MLKRIKQPSHEVGSARDAAKDSTQRENVPQRMPYVTAVKRRAIIANSATLNLCLKLRARTTWTLHSWMLFRTRWNDPGLPKYESAESSYHLSWTQAQT